MNIERNNIYNMDCMEGMKAIPDGSVDLVVTDPPYLIPHTDAGGNDYLGITRSLSDLTTKQVITEGYDMNAFAREIERLQGKDINIYLWCNKLQIPEYFDIYVKGMKCKFDILCWHKLNTPPTYSNKYLTDTEYCLFFHKGNGQTHPKSAQMAKTYWETATNIDDKEKWGHPTIKPCHMMQKLILNSSKECDVVLDPFMGSGTTAIACIREKRDFIGFEMNKEYYEKSLKRIEVERMQPTFDFGS